jgi:DNA-binding MarR family transcriptional regulator
MMLSGPGVPVRDRVLLHLAEFRNMAEAVEVPGGMSQSGIALALDVNRSQVTRALSELKAKDLIDERVTYVKGAVRRCRTYNCTYPGEAYAERLKTILLEMPAEFRDSAGTVKRLRMGDVYAGFRGGVPFSRFLIAVLEDRVMLDYSQTDINARPAPRIVGGVETSPPPPPDGEPGGEAPGGQSVPAGVAVPAEDVAGTEEALETVVMEERGAGESAPGALDYRATYDSVLPSRFYEPERAPPPPGMDPRDPRLYQGWKPRTDQAMPVFAVMVFILSLVGLVIISIAGAYYGTGCICLFWAIIGLVISGVMLVSWSKNVERTGLLRLPQRERLAVTGVLVVGTVATLFFLGLLAGTTGGGRPGATDILAILMVGVPLYGAVLFRSGMPDHVRAELGVSAGWFMLLVPAGLQLFPYAVEYSIWMTGVWTALGAGLVVMASDTGGLKAGPMLAAALPGLGGSAALLCALAIYDGRPGWAGDALGLAALAAWVGLGLFLVVLPFLKAETVKSIQGALGSIGLMAFGVALAFLGLGLVRAGIVVGAVELVLAAPALFYGWRRFRAVPAEGAGPRLRLLVVVLAVVIVTLARALFLF